ncbi:MAG: branched-chain amino acid ABC transporter permease [Bacillales bacterium]|jgi:branched-chain amino acid transport system permease protein|nr:branched-chain amino acid ABC transporter permease [Bacillales bacterium]
MFGLLISLGGASMWGILQNLIATLTQFSFLGLATFVIVLIFKTSSTTNFAQGMLGVVGAFVTSYLISNAGSNDILGAAKLPDWSTLIILPILGGVLVSFVFGLLIDVVIFRRAKYTNAVTKQIITMGIVIAINGLIPFVFGIANRISYPFSSSTINIPNTPLSIPEHTVATLIIAILLIGGIFALLKFTKLGLGFRATASNEKVANLMGVNTNVTNALSWAIAGALGALSAITFSASTGVYLNAGIMTNMQINAFYSSILGGFQTFHGPLVGAFIFTFGQSFIPMVLVKVGLSSWSNTVLYMAILIIVLIKPSGIIGKVAKKKV